MPIVNATIKTEILNLLDQIDTYNKSSGADAVTAQDMYAQGLADIIESAIKSITITHPIGLIAVAGTPSAQANAVPIVLTNGVL